MNLRTTKDSEICLFAFMELTRFGKINLWKFNCYYSILIQTLLIVAIVDYNCKKKIICSMWVYTFSNRVRNLFCFSHSFFLSLFLFLSLSLSLSLSFLSLFFLSHVYYRHSLIFSSLYHLNQLRIIQAHFSTFHLQTNYVSVNPFQLSCHRSVIKFY